MKGIIGLVAALLAIGAIAIFATSSVSAADIDCTQIGTTGQLSCESNPNVSDVLKVTWSGGASFDLTVKEVGVGGDTFCVTGNVSNNSGSPHINGSTPTFTVHVAGVGTPTPQPTPAEGCAGKVGGVVDLADVDAAAALGNESSDSNTALWASVAAAAAVAAVAVGGGVVYARRRAN